MPRIRTRSDNKAVSFRIRRRRWSAVLLIAVLALLVAGRIWLWPPLPVGSPHSIDAFVERAIDGDTLLLANGERVRLLGVNTPETKHPTKPVEPFGPEAYEFTRQHVEGRAVRLVLDRERRDEFGRLLAYVYRGDWLLNEELIRAGLSKAQTRFNYSDSMKRRFLAAERLARSEHRGLWMK